MAAGGRAITLSRKNSLVLGLNSEEVVHVREGLSSDEFACVHLPLEGAVGEGEGIKRPKSELNEHCTCEARHSDAPTARRDTRRLRPRRTD